jgi:hypothetical protein
MTSTQSNLAWTVPAHASTVQDLEQLSLPVPVPGAGQVLVRIAAVALTRVSGCAQAEYRTVLRWRRRHPYGRAFVDVGWSRRSQCGAASESVVDRRCEEFGDALWRRVGGCRWYVLWFVDMC